MTECHNLSAVTLVSATSVTVTSVTPALLLKGQAVGALGNCGVSLMSAYLNAVKRAVMLRAKVVLAAGNIALD